MRAFAALTVVLLVVLRAATARASSCDELVRSARAQEASGEVDRALRLYTDAITLDPTCSAAYLGLGALRERSLDLREAERVYSIALEHVPTLADAHERRAGVRFRLGFHEDAVAELRALVDAPQGDDALRHATAALRQLAIWYGEERQLPAQLACWRRLLATAERVADEALARESKNMVRALQLLVGPADPVTHPPVRPTPLRALVARTAASF